MKRAVALLLVLPAAAAFAAPPRSCVKVIDRAKNVVSALGRANWTPIRAEIGVITKDKKVSLTRELDAATYYVFAVGDEKAAMQLSLNAMDSSGKSLKKKHAIGEVGIDELVIEKKDKTKFELECEDAQADSGHYIIVVLQKIEGPPSAAEVVLDHMQERAKAIEDAGHEVVWGELDTIADGKTWTVERKLDAGHYMAEVATDEDKVKDLEVELKDGADQSVAKKEKSKEPKDGHLASLKGDAKAGNAKLNVTGVFNEGSKESFAGVLLAKK